MTRIATISQSESGIYQGEITDEYGDIESAITAGTAFDVHMWAFERNCSDVELTYHNNNG